MHYLKFLDQLFDSGRVVIESSELASTDSISDGKARLAEFEELWRQQLAYEVPEFDPEPASWAAHSFYRACQLLMHRSEVADKKASEELPEPTFDIKASSTHYNIDLVFRFLPDLWSFAGTNDQGDWLSKRIGQWCSQWPLSSVGVANPPADFDVDIEGFVSSPCLMQLYADRIIRKADLSRVDDERVANVIENSIGNFPQLAKRFRTELSQSQTSKEAEPQP